MNVRKHWTQWHLHQIRMFDTHTGQSSLMLDRELGANRTSTEFQVIGSTLYFMKLDDLIGPFPRSKRPIAKRPLPDTAEEALTWMRMVAAVYGGKNDNDQ